MRPPIPRPCTAGSVYIRFTSPTPSSCRRRAPHATARPLSSRATNTVVSGCAICSTVMCEQNWGGVCSSRYAFSSAMSVRTSSCRGVSAAMVTSIAQIYELPLRRCRGLQSPYVHADDRPVRLVGRRAPRIVLGLLSCALGLSVTSVAAADDYKRAIDERDQTAATAAVLRKADFGALQVTGGPIKPDTSTDERCSYYNPKESDLVLTGEAESSWRGALMEFSSDVSVLRSPQMVATDWARSFTPAPFLRCMRELAQKGLGS